MERFPESWWLAAVVDRTADVIPQDATTRQAAHRVMEEEQRVAKLKRFEERAVRSARRREQSKERGFVIARRIDQLREVDCSTRLSALASDNSLPLEAIPSTLIIECISEARNLDNDS